MYRTKVAFFVLLTTLETLSATSIVFLEGSARSGKSNICSAITAYENWATIDSHYSFYSHAVFNNLFPREFSCIQEHIAWENITHALTRNMFIFKLGIGEEQKKDVFNAVRKIQDYFSEPKCATSLKEGFADFSLDEIDVHLAKGRNIVVSGGWFVSREQIKNLNPKITLLSALAYCPLDIILDRLCKRNEMSIATDNLKTHRFFADLLKSFFFLYDLTPESTQALDILTKTVFLECLKKIEDCLPEIDANMPSSKFIVKELTRKQLQEYREIFLKLFGDQEYLYVVPKTTYEIIIRTDKQSSQQCAEQIITYVVHNAAC